MNHVFVWTLNDVIGAAAFGLAVLIVAVYGIATLVEWALLKRRGGKR